LNKNRCLGRANNSKEEIPDNALSVGPRDPINRFLTIVWWKKNAIGMLRRMRKMWTKNRGDGGSEKHSRFAECGRNTTQKKLKKASIGYDYRLKSEVRKVLVFSMHCFSMHIDFGNLPLCVPRRQINQCDCNYDYDYYDD
jgi:hypothetical protein